MTTFGGNVLVWSATGDINAGKGAKTTVVYQPPRQIYDNYGNVALALSGAIVILVAYLTITGRDVQRVHGAAPLAAAGSTIEHTPEAVD